MTLPHLSKFWIGVLGIIVPLATACDPVDPALNEELASVRAARDALQRQLSASQDDVRAAKEEARTAIAEARAQEAKATEALAAVRARFDRRSMEMSFAEAALQLKDETLKKYPGHRLGPTTIREMVMPSDHPFSSGLTVELRNDQTGESQKLHWEGRGTLDGEWVFKQVAPEDLGSEPGENWGPPPPPPPPLPPRDPADSPDRHYRKKGNVREIIWPEDS